MPARDAHAVVRESSIYWDLRQHKPAAVLMERMRILSAWWRRQFNPAADGKLLIQLEQLPDPAGTRDRISEP